MSAGLARKKRMQEQIRDASDVLVLFNGLLGISGGDRHLLDMAYLWGEQTHALTQAALPRLAERVLLKDDLNRMRVRFIWSPFERHSVSSTLAVSAAYGWRIIGCSLARFSPAPKIVIASGHLPFDVVPALMLSRRYGARSVVYVFHLIQKQSRKPGPRYAIAKLAEDLSLYLMRRFDLVITDNMVVRDQLVALGIPEDKIRITALGIPSDTIRNAASSPVEYEAAFFGRLVWYKGIYDIVDAWQQVVAKLTKSRLLIIGDGPERHSLEQYIKNKGLTDNIDLAGFAYPPKSYELLKKCRLGLFPSHEEGWGISVCEAMACGLPIVAYDLPAYRSVYQRGMVTAPLGDWAGLAVQVCRLLTDDVSLRDLASEAVLQASKYDVRTVAQTQWKWLLDLTGPN
jgi:glycosyltransferase involved in cell wall biosynthesis